MTEPSAAYQLVTLVWTKCSHQKSWQRLNQSMSSALMLAVTAGLRFDIDDFRTIRDNFRGGFWFGAEHERYFAEAVKHGNISACRAYEKWVGRKPFIYEGKRLYVGSEIDYHCGRVSVTSFKNEENVLVACGYEGAKKYPRKPTKRVSITRTVIQAMEKERKSVAREAKAGG